MYIPPPNVKKKMENIEEISGHLTSATKPLCFCFIEIWSVATAGVLVAFLCQHRSCVSCIVAAEVAGIKAQYFLA